ncbi:hypothetical protein BABINDRAFT_163252 [Babjeviella inositovora NRRL Y-12698]|uniref:Diacylglycerol O-acyltransferase n=1 Tax=Babjeviella inositovora NRRL Y-12698 TaxID=984486 RepID=A0A1E3QLL3_9ASCO|nr:uncharacterized protein BABINDRAFT_163252 [Babjeviella inositovora NRRL Y-12698]ODQ77877.1 hypothetical protein BABINDRAFT_163252 [Babjeviella inositovora NRRL Y-12698]
MTLKERSTTEPSAASRSRRENVSSSASSSASDFARPPPQSSDSFSDTESVGGLEINIKGRNIRFAPMNTPLHRRWQTLAVLWHTCTIPCLTSLFCYMLAIPFMWPFIGIYLIYFLCDQTPFNGNAARRYSPRVRGLPVWRSFVEYFPIRIHKTVDLQPTFTQKWVEDEPETNWFKRALRGAVKKPFEKRVKTGPRYMFCYHPHGIISMGAFGAMATEGAGWSKAFPGIPVSLLTLINQFKLPLLRDYIMALGCSSVGKRNMTRIIRDHNQSVCIVVGGAQESLLALPHSNDLVLRKRKGFIKLALDLGDISLVPIYAFGENEVYEVNKATRGSWIWKFQKWTKKNFGFTVPLFHARGVFNYSMGLMPFRKQIDLVYGKPIEIPFRPSPTRKEVEFYHDLYVKGLVDLFDQNKAKYGDPNAVLSLVE